MANGWQRLGEAFAGVSPAARADIEAKAMNQLAQRDSNVSRAKMDLEKARHFNEESLGRSFMDIGSPDPEVSARGQARVALTGVNYNSLQSGLGSRQEQLFRQAARDQAAGGNMGAANAELFGIASGPVEIPKVTDGVLLSNRLIPGGGEVSATPVGESRIRANDARAQASLINANKSRANGGAGEAKLSDIDKARMKADLDVLVPQMEVVLDDIARNRGATVGPGVRKLAEAQAVLADLQAQQQAIFDKYSNAAGSPGAAPSPRVSEMFGVPVPAGMTPDQFGQAVAFNQGLRSEGQPDMTRDEMAQFLSSGEFSRGAPAAAASAEAINPRLFDRYQQSLTGSASPPPAQGTLPSAARSRLAEGKQTTFANGQVWTLRGGEPVRVK